MANRTWQILEYLVVFLGTGAMGWYLLGPVAGLIACAASVAVIVFGSLRALFLLIVWGSTMLIMGETNVFAAMIGGFVSGVLYLISASFGRWHTNYINSMKNNAFFDDD